MAKLIVISGTPAVGKSTLAKLLVKELGFSRLDISHHYQEISTSYNRSKQCYDVDLKKLEKLVREFKKKQEKDKKNIVVDSHLAHLLPKKMVDLCLVLTCSNLKKLEKRLKKRKYSKKKIRENLDAEIFQVCLTEAQEKDQQVMIIDVEKIDFKKKINQKKILIKIGKLL